MGAPYIYDISRLKVNNLTLFLLTWRKWWSPNNASKYQMGFNSGFKGLSVAVQGVKKIHRIFSYISNKMQRYTVYFIWKLLYIFRVVPPPIIRCANSCIYSIWYLSHRYCYLPLSWKSRNWSECVVGGVAVTVWKIPGAVDTAVCAPDDGWWYHPKRLEQFPDKLCNIASCWII